MPKLIKNSEIIEDNWSVADADSASFSSSDLLSLEQFQANPEASKGLWIESDIHPDDIPTDIANSADVIAINFPKFADGRGYTIARLLREQHGYQGELRAIGDVLLDQLFYMQRVGFNSFVVREDKDIEKGVALLGTFTETYQISNDQPQPLFRRR